MKRNFRFVCGAAVLGVLLSGCSFSIPKKYKVVSKAEYNFTLMNTEMDLSEKLPLDSMFSSMPETMTVYDYNPGGNSKTKQYLMTMPVGEPIELDMSTYIQDDLYKGDPIKFKKELEMPKADITETKYFSTSKVSRQMNSMVNICGPVTNSTINAVPDKVGESFGSITYAAGIMKIYIQNAVDGVSTVDIKKNGVSLIGGPATFEACTPVDKTFNIEQAGVSTSVTRTMNYYATVDLAGKSLYMNDIAMSFTNCTESGNTFYAEVFSDSVVSSATGVTVKDYTVPMASEEITVDLGDEKKIKELTVADGDLSLVVSEPASWNNSNISFSYKTSGNLVVDSGNSGKASLNGKVLKEGDKFVPTVKLNITNADLDLSSTEIKLSFATDIRTIAEVVLDTTKLDKDEDGNYKELKTSKSQNEPLSNDVTKMVKEIWFNASTFDVKYTNTLPAGNDIDLNVNSTFLSLYDSVTMTAGSTDETTSFTSTADDTTQDGKKTKKGDGTNEEVDFTADIVMPGYNATEKTITLKNIVPSKGENKQTYKIALEVTPHIEWIQVKADMSSVDMEPASTDTGIKFNSIMSFFGDDFCKNVKMESVPVYIYSEKPELDAFADVSVTGKISIFCDETVKKIEFLGDGNTLDLSANPPALLLDETEKTATVDLASETVKYAAYKDIADVIDFSSAETLKISYDLALSGASEDKSVIIKKTDLNGKKSSFRNYAYIVLPMSFKVTEETMMGMSGLTGSGDLLGRTEAPAESESSSPSYLSAIESFTLYIHSSKVPFATSSERNISFYLDLDGDEYKNGKYFDLEEGSYQLTREEIKNAMTQYPFIPEVKIAFPAGVLSINRDFTLKSKIDFQLKTDGTIDIPVSGSDE